MKSSLSLRTANELLENKLSCTCMPSQSPYTYKVESNDQMMLPNMTVTVLISDAAIVYCVS